MGLITLSSITLTPLQRIPTPGGDVMHAIKCSDPGYVKFGEAYFSWVEPGAVKAWKMHRKMTLNLIVPVGSIRFVFQLPEEGTRIVEVGVNNYSRLTIPPAIWFGFQGRAAVPSLLLNLADIPHDPNEIQRRDMADLLFDWRAP